MASWKACILSFCAILSVEARSFKTQENALVEESVQADFTCGQWSQPRTICTGTGVNTSGKTDTECNDWCATQGVGCCETSTSGECRFVAGDGSWEYSPESTELRATYCIGDVFTQIDTGFRECGPLDGKTVLDVVNPTRIQCQDACVARSESSAEGLCFFAAWGGGLCHLYNTCDGSTAGFWLVDQRANPCSNVTCPAVDMCHNGGTCEIQSGTCSTPEVADGSSCNDDDPLTTSDQCTSGVCSGSAAGATGDPHFVGFDGSRYDFQGTPGFVFNLITDEAFQLNARFVESPTNGKTYMGVIGFRVGPNEVIVSPDVVVVNDRQFASGEHVYLYDGEESVGLVHFDDSHLKVKSTSFQVDVLVKQQGEFVYLDVSTAANSDHLSHPHGILGQTAQYLVDGAKPEPVRLSHHNLYASGFLAGSPDDYVVADGLLGTDFAFNRFGIEASTAKSKGPRRFGFGRILYQA